jgi:hypothetical protein
MGNASVDLLVFLLIARIADDTRQTRANGHAKTQRSPIAMGVARRAHYVDYKCLNPTCG